MAPVSVTLVSSLRITTAGRDMIWSSAVSRERVRPRQCLALITTARTSTSARTLPMAKASSVFAEKETLAERLLRDQLSHQRIHQRQLVTTPKHPPILP